VHSYEGSNFAARCASDIAEWLATGTTDGWEGHDPAAMVEPNADEIRNGGYEIVALDRNIDTAASLAAELRETRGRAAEQIADALSPRTVLGSPCPHCGKRLAVQRHDLDDGETVYGRPDDATTEHVTTVAPDGTATCVDRVIGGAL
jgi:hypothetical protein